MQKVEMIMDDGQTLQFTLRMADLFKLENARKDIYDQVSKGMNGQNKDLPHAVVDVLYGAYLCANIDDLDSCINKDSFIEILPEYADQMVTYQALIQKKKAV